MKITLVTPNYYPSSTGPRSWKSFLSPLPGNIVPAYLHALTPNNLPIEFKIADIGFPYDTSSDVYMFSFVTAEAPFVYRQGASLREQGKTVVYGGVHVSSLNKIGLLEEALQFADSVVLGEADSIWLTLLNDLHSGNLKQVYNGELADMQKFPVLKPSDRALQIKHPNFSMPFSSVSFSKGCPNSCEYCSIIEIYGRQYRVRTLDHILDEIQNLPKIQSFYGKKRYLSFTDDNLLGKKIRGEALLEALAKMGDIGWIGGISSDLITTDIVDLLKKSGALALFIGFDKFSGDDLVGKHQSRFEEKAKLLHDKGIAIEAATIVGHDSDTPETFQKIYDFMVKNKIEMPSVNMLTAYPGTTLWQRVKEEGRLLYPVESTNDWLNWAHYTTEEANIKHPTMSSEELNKRYNDLWIELFKLKSIRQRFSGKFTNPMILPNIMYNSFLGDELRLLKPILKMARLFT